MTSMCLHYHQREFQSSLTVKSPIQWRVCIDETVHRHAKIVPEILALHALTVCDTLAATYGVGNASGIAVTCTRKGFTLDQMGQVISDLANVMKQATAFIANYGFTRACSSMTEWQSTKLTFVLTLWAWCVFHVFGCALPVYYLSSCVYFKLMLSSTWWTQNVFKSAHREHNPEHTLAPICWV